ncbi:MAG TPA: ORF6N domain-containing protein [Chryseosolibacter sp.]
MRKSVSITDEHVFEKIFLIRNQKVLLDAHIAKLYGIETKRLKEAVKRNQSRFPKDFIVLNKKEFANLRSQFATSSWGGDRYSPMAFTEQGVAMLSSVINTERAIAVNIQIMRAFTKMRQMIFSYKELLKRIEKLEDLDLKKADHIRNIYDMIKELLEPSIRNRGQIGFKISGK